MQYLGHYQAENHKQQLLRSHLNNVAQLAKHFANSFNEGMVAEVIGKYHDVGKYSEDFQRYIRGETKCHIDHSTAGAQLMMKYNHPLSVIIALCIAGHHGGIPNLGTKTDSVNDTSLMARNKRVLLDYQAYKQEFETNPLLLLSSNVLHNLKSRNSIDLALYVRMLYSSLVDADFLDTERFMLGDNTLRDMKCASLVELHCKVMEYIQCYLSNPVNTLNKKRCDILWQCIDFGKNNSRNLFRLTVPTGGGKTISSLAFAINHAIQNHMERIIYVIPYTSIIEQNAKIFANIVGEDNVLEHHMGVEYDETSDYIVDKKKLATENWDAPIVVTTNVQFFESIFSNKPSKCRKIHNIANSVIIFDEVQMLPIDYLKSCTYSIMALVRSFNCTAVLCSATQPSLETVINKEELLMSDIVNNIEENEAFFKRNVVCRLEEKINKEELVNKLSNHKQMLCVVNKKKTAQELFDLLKNKIHNDGVYHLSTNMCSAHRIKILSEIKSRLSNNLMCLVIATSLIEAGVDLDFAVVYRELAGLDNIIQSAGRCNREGKRQINDSVVWVFELCDCGKVNYDIAIRSSCTLNVMSVYKDWLSSEAIRFYFCELYSVNTDRIDSHDIINKSNVFDFKKISEDFQIIENNTKLIFIPFDEEAHRLVQNLRQKGIDKKTRRLMAKYLVSVYSYVYNELEVNNKLYVVEDKIAILTDLCCYDNYKGLCCNFGKLSIHR